MKPCSISCAVATRRKAWRAGSGPDSAGQGSQRESEEQSIRSRSPPWMNLLQLEAAAKLKRIECVVFYEHLLLHSVMTMHAMTRANDTID